MNDKEQLSLSFEHATQKNKTLYNRSKEVQKKSVKAKPKLSYGQEASMADQLEQKHRPKL